jgi:hypothetical protein
LFRMAPLPVVVVPLSLWARGPASGPVPVPARPPPAGTAQLAAEGRGLLMADVKAACGAVCREAEDLCPGGVTGEVKPALGRDQCAGLVAAVPPLRTLASKYEWFSANWPQARAHSTSWKTTHGSGRVHRGARRSP